MTDMTRAMSCLLEILNDEDVPTRRRIEAAQALLAFESPREAADVARQYLLQVFEDKEVDIDLRMEALQVSRKYESARVAPPVVKLSENKDFIEEQRRQAILRRRIILVMQGIEPLHFPPDWKSDLEAPDWIPPTPEQVQEQRDYMHSLRKTR